MGFGAGRALGDGRHAYLAYNPYRSIGTGPSTPADAPGVMVWVALDRQAAASPGGKGCHVGLGRVQRHRTASRRYYRDSPPAF